MADIDMEAGVAKIVEGLGFEPEEPVEAPAETAAPETPEEPKQVVANAETPVVPPTTPVVKAPPQSWAKETHELWGKLPPEAQEQVLRREQQMLQGLEQYKSHFGIGKSMSEAIKPYEQVLQQQGVDAPKAVSVLLAAHQRLTTGTPEQRMAAYQDLGRQLGLSQAQGDPAAVAALQKIQQIEQQITQREREMHAAAMEKTAKEVEAFASDPAHPYFDEVAEDIVHMISAGHSLQDAYDKAIWANPVTRAKEQSRLQQETEKQLREKSAKEAEAARKASSANVRSRDTRKASTEPLGKMEDTLKDTFREIQNRTH